MKRYTSCIIGIAILGIGYNAYHWLDGLTQNRIGYLVLKYGKDERQAFQFFRQSAERGNPKGAFNLGLCYIYGQGTARDLNQARYWLSKSNRPKAKLLLEELGQKENLQYPFADYKPEPFSPELIKKAQNGDRFSQFALGKWYQEGNGVPQDFNEALKWYKLSAEQGFDKAQNNLGLSYIRGIDPKNWGFITVYGQRNTYPINPENKKPSLKKESKEIERTGFELIEKAALQNNPSAMNNMGSCFENGLGSKRDSFQAFEWYKKSSDLGYPPGQNNLGRCYQKGIGTSVNLSNALILYKKSAENGFELAKKNLKELEAQSSTNPQQNP